MLMQVKSIHIAMNEYIGIGAIDWQNGKDGDIMGEKKRRREKKKEKENDWDNKIRSKKEVAEERKG